MNMYLRPVCSTNPYCPYGLGSEECKECPYIEELRKQYKTKEEDKV